MAAGTTGGHTYATFLRGLCGGGNPFVRCRRRGGRHGREHFAAGPCGTPGGVRCQRKGPSEEPVPGVALLDWSDRPPPCANRFHPTTPWDVEVA
eukprot:8917578-Pyramimonas_sp.AAC.1